MEFHDAAEIVTLAQRNGTESEARQRMADRLVTDRGPKTAASTGSWVNWGAEQSWLGQPWDNARIPLAKLEQMRRDPILAFGLMFCKVPLVRAPWYIKSSDPRIAAAVDGALRRVYGRFILAYTNSLDFGFSPMVKRFEYEEKPDWTYIPKDDPNGEETLVWNDKVVKPIVWKQFTPLNPRKCKPHWDSRGNFNGIDFQTPDSGMSPFFSSGFAVNNKSYTGESQKRLPDIPVDWALWATNEKDSEFDSYWGYPRIGYAYRLWWEYWHRFNVASRAFEKWGDPPVMVFHPDTALDTETNYTNEALALAESLRSGANVAMPSSVVESLQDGKVTNVREWMIEQMESKVNLSGFTEQFEYLDVMKLRAVMVPEQALIEGSGGTSSRNVAATNMDSFQESQAVVKTQIDEHINRWIIPQFIETNFGKDAAKAEIVTTGFESQDMETMREIVQLIGQRQPLSMVDMRRVFQQLGVPTVSVKETNRRLAEEAAKAETMATPPPVTARAGASTGFAGVDENGHYYEQRDRIVLNERNIPYVVEKVDELPDLGENGPAAYFAADERTLYIRKDADPEAVKGYMLGFMADKLTDGGEKIPGEAALEVILSEIKNVNDRVTEFQSRETKVSVELNNPQPRRTVKEQELIRDEQGNLLSIKTVEEEVLDDEEN